MAVLGLDLGGTKLAGALFSDAGEVRHRQAAPLGGRGGRDVGALIARTALDLIDRAGGDPVTGVGVAIPGIYRSASGTVWAPNIPGWDDYPLEAELRDALPAGLDVRVDSDRACAILGEAWGGAAAGSRNAIFLVVGTGIGAGILIEGEVLRGRGDAAGAIGWLALDRPHRPGYEAVGCFEFHASGTGIAGRARDLVAKSPDYRGPLRTEAPAGAGALSATDGPARTGGGLTARDVFAAYDQGDEVARRVLGEAVAYWGMAVANLVSLFNPERIIFGGGVFGPASRFLDAIREEAARWAQPVSMTQVELLASALGDDAVLHGAGRLALPAAAAAPEGKVYP